MKKRILLLSLIICLVLTGCEAVIDNDSVLGAYSDNDDDTILKTEPMTDITLLYYPDMDTNPLTTDCYANHEVLKLVYSPLIRVDEDFRPYGVLANTFSIDKNTVTVTLREGLKFSDGSEVTAHDVEKSINVVRKNQDSPYYQSAKRFSRYYAVDSRTFVCVLDSADVDAAALLDIPVMKNGTEQIGCGPYIFSKNNGKDVLILNESYFEKAKVPLIKLVESKNDTLITGLFSSGELDIISVAGYDDLSLSSLRDYEIISSGSNNFIYIGINFNDPVFQNADIRKAISVCIDREKIASQSLVGLAEGTMYPFNPSWYRLRIYNTDVLPDRTNDDLAKATALLKDIPLTLTVPKDSDIKMTIANNISETFKSLGLNFTVNQLETDEYTTSVKSGDFQLYLGETAISRNMDPTYLYKTGGSMNYTGYSNTELDELFLNYKNGETGLDKYLTAFSDNMPIIPVLFRKNVMYSAKGITGYTKLSPWNSLGDITTITLK